jgi:hypothetical protein
LLRKKILHFSFSVFHLIWASRCAQKKPAMRAFFGLRRAIRGSLRSYLMRLRAFRYGAQARRRYYPSRCKRKRDFVFKNIQNFKT